MTDPISDFFNAWEISDSAQRAENIANSVTPEVEYDDPRTPETIRGVDALCQYVGMFSENAPGWKADVVKSDTINRFTRVTVAFSGIGPDGEQKIQLGQYFVEKSADKISKIVGFVGTGQPD